MIVTVIGCTVVVTLGLPLLLLGKSLFDVAELPAKSFNFSLFLLLLLFICDCKWYWADVMYKISAVQLGL